MERLRRTRKSKEEDLFLQLPDHITHSILSFLPLRDAVKTSVLSSRWMNYWMSCPHLLFDGPNILGGVIIDYGRESELFRQRSEFVTRVTQFMKNRRHGGKIDSLAIHFHLDYLHMDQLNEWISIAISKQVEEIELNLWDKFTPDHAHYYRILEARLYAFEYELIIMDQRRKSTVKHLCLDSCSFLSPVRFNGSSSLITIDFKRVNMTDQHLQNVLSTSSCLEWLSLDRCRGISNLNVTASELQKLKYLNVNCCFTLQNVEVRNENLAVFEYTGPPVRLILNEVPKLAKFSLSFISGDIKGSITEALTKLPAKLPALQTFNLLLNLDMKTVILPEDALVFTNVKQLILTIVPLKDDDDFIWMTYILKAFPFLQKLQLNLFSSSSFSTKEIRPIPECHHEHLKEVEVNGFRGNHNEIALIQHLSRNAVGIEADDIIFNWECKRYRGFNDWEVDEHISSFDRRKWNQLKTSLRRELKTDQGKKSEPAGKKRRGLKTGDDEGKKKETTYKHEHIYISTSN